MAVAEGKSGVSDEMGQTIITAEETLATVVVETLLGLLDGGLEGESGSRAGLVLLEALVQSLDLRYDKIY